LAKRNAEYREQEYDASQTLLNVVRCCLANFGERDLEKMRLSELSRALQIACIWEHPEAQTFASTFGQKISPPYNRAAPLNPMENERCKGLTRFHALVWLFHVRV
jgi:hypothetical protein